MGSVILLLMKIKQFASCVGISRQAVYKAFERKKLDQTPEGGVDLEGRRTRAYLVGYGLTGAQVREIAAGARPVPQPRKERLVTPEARKKSPPGKKLKSVGAPPAPPTPAPWVPPGPIAPPLDVTGISDERLFAQDADVLQKIAAAEKIIDLRQTRAAKRGELISRDTVKRFMDGLVSIHRSELTTLGAKTAPEIMSACGVNEDSALVRIEEVLDAAVYRVIAHIQRQTTDFLRGLKVADDAE